MKKLLAILFAALFVLGLSACPAEKAETPVQSGEHAGEKTEENSFGGDLLARIREGQGEGWQQVAEDEPFGVYRSEEELLAILESGDFSAYDVIFEEASEPLVVEAEQEGGEDFTYDPGEGVSDTFSEAEAAEAVKGGLVYIDWKSMMDPEALAEWEAFDPNDPEILAQVEEADRMDEKLQQEVDEAMKDIDMDEINRQMEEALQQAQQELEDLELPEGYEDMLGGLDLGSLLGGLS